ncbi:MAG: dephospho-CoA kinase [Aeoliella sp.]
MYTIGLVGGVASGKSMVAEMLAEFGAVVLNADRAAHNVLTQPEVQAQLVARWGRGILLEDGVIDRQAVARIVFGDDPPASEEREFLESVVHPLARAALETKRKLLAQEGKEVFVIDAPLLLEAGWDSACDCVIFVDTPDSARLVFAQKRGWPSGELVRRENAQMPLATKRHRADLVLDNSIDIAKLRQQIEIFWQEMVLPQLGD